MNILFALSQLEVTGAEVYAAAIGNQLSDREHTVYYVSDTFSKKVFGDVFSLRFNKRSLFRRVWHVIYLIYLIKRYRVQIVHAHSRASGWSSYIACKLTNTAMVTTVHGRQPVHGSRKKFHALGTKAIAVCENVADQIYSELGVPKSMIEVIRNGVSAEEFSPIKRPNNDRKVITIIGRLSGPKGELLFTLLNEVLDSNLYEINSVGGSEFPDRFSIFRQKVNFEGYVDDIRPYIERSDLVIGAGRVAVESILMGCPTFAIGEAKSVGLVRGSNVEVALKSNFGDIGEKEMNIDFSILDEQISEALLFEDVEQSVIERVKEEFSLQGVVDRIEEIYQSEYVYQNEYEIPVVMYHRVISGDDEGGQHRLYVTSEQFEGHLKLLRKKGIEALFFSDLDRNGLISRLEEGKRFIIITFDDGYRDNYINMFPLLKKYDVKATIYQVTGEDHNRWDVDESGEENFPLMSRDQMIEMSGSGLVEFGGHTRTHPRLTKIEDQVAADEIIGNRSDLEEITGVAPVSFAYPYGDLSERTKKVVSSAGYSYAVATDSGPLAMHQDSFQIRRISIFPGTTTHRFWRKIKGNNEFRYAKKGGRNLRY